MSLNPQNPKETTVHADRRHHPPSVYTAELSPSTSFDIDGSLGHQGSPGTAKRTLVAILFTDIVDSTSIAARLGDAAWLRLLERHDELVRVQIRRFGGSVVKHTGDGFLATFDAGSRAVECALEVAHAATSAGLEVRAGVHVGEVGVRADGDIVGLAVNIGSRIASLAASSEVLVSETVKELVAGSELQLTDHGEHRLKGVARPWRLFCAHRGTSDCSPASRPEAAPHQSTTPTFARSSSVPVLLTRPA